MATSVVRINEASKERLRQLAKQIGESMPSVLDKAIETYRRKRFLKGVNEAYALLRKDSKAWTSLQDEQVHWDTTLMDGLDLNEDWSEKK